MVDKQPVDTGDEGEEPQAPPEEPTGPLLSFDSDAEAMPHWADAPTGEIPVFEAPGADEPSSGGSRLFPQLPDDPNMVDTTDTSRFQAVRSDTLPSLPTEQLAEGPDAAVEPPAEATGAGEAGGAGAVDGTGNVDDMVFAPNDDPLATGPMEMIDAGAAQDGPTSPPSVVPEPAPPVADTTVIRGLGERDPGAQFDTDAATDARDEELHAATALAGGQPPDFEPLSSDVSGSASLEPGETDELEPVVVDESAADLADEPLFGDAAADDAWSRLERLPDIEDSGSDPDDRFLSSLEGRTSPEQVGSAASEAHLTEPSSPEPTASEPPAAQVSGDFPSPPDVSALFDDDAPAIAAPLGAGVGGEGEGAAEDATSEPADRLDSWADLDAPAPHWREGNQDYEERAAVNDDERTVLHLDDQGDASGEGGGAGRNLPMAIAVGLGLAGAFFGLLYVGPGAAMGLVVVALVLAAAEFYQAVRHVGYRPAALLGLVGVAALALAVYWRGFEAYPLVLGLMVLVGLLWFLFGVEGEHATANLAITLMGFGWIGVLGSFAAMILKLPDGEAVLIGAVVGTVAYDVGGYVIGRTTGQSRLAPHISPNKTYEGLIGGMILAIVVTTLTMNSIPGVFPWTESMTDALWLGIAVAVMAPLGDLSQSLIKRDLGVKDMGTILPGHGGVFDRFDGLLFVLPAAFYVADLVVY